MRGKLTSVPKQQQVLDLKEQGMAANEICKKVKLPSLPLYLPLHCLLLAIVEMEQTLIDFSEQKQVK